MAEHPKRDWKTLAQLASVEQDPEKLTKIVHELNDVLLERERRRLGNAQSRRILLLDDDENIGTTLVPVLREHGFEVKLAATVTEALREIRSHQFDILVSDLNVSEPNDGFKVVAAMREAHPNCVIILLTGYPAFESAIAGIHHAVDDYIVKPAAYDALIQKLEEKLVAKRGF